VKPCDLVVGRWGAQFMGRRFACTIGRGGARVDKREGDGATPVGTHRFVGMLYRADRMTKPADWARPIGPFDGWSDDGRDDAYNQMIRHPHPFSAERLHRADPMYDLILITDWNWPYATVGHGSAIFLHQWRRPHARTAGCVALARADLLWIAQRIRHESRLIILP
jgi:L,D-peptidoglycan transpeptidase YkuD (ErfK/YbiS/YcfS/YnhG family)